MLRLLSATLVIIGSQASVLAVAPGVLESEAERVRVIERVSQSTIAIFDGRGQGGGSGVIISPDGYALTNFHVTAPCGPAMRCGTNDGRLYDAVLVGLDPPGDVALIKLLGRDDFPAAEFGNSDTAMIGDSVLVVGNPFLLAEDFRPTVTYGILSGTHRYQYPAGTLLEYADCLQTDAAINPGNSGGPLFDANGKLIGINGRGSFEKRGRVNVGVGYAISINQIKLFLSHLKAGRVVDHATLGATVTTLDDGRVAIDDLLEESDAYRRGLRYGDYLTSFAGRDITTANALKNVLGIYPAGWTVPIEFVRDGDLIATDVRLASLHGQGELESLIEAQAQKPVPIQPPGPKDDDEDQRQPEIPNIRDLVTGTEEPKLPEAVDQVYKERAGFANYYFNELHQQRLANNCRGWGAFSADQQLVIGGVDSRGHEVAIESTQLSGSFRSVRGQFFADFIDPNIPNDGPPGSGGLMEAIREWHMLLSRGLEGLDEAYYMGELPFGAMQRRHDCLATVRNGLPTYFYFSRQSGRVVGIEHFTADDRDPCTIRFSNFQPWDSAELPLMWVVRFGENAYAEFTVDHYQQVPLQESEDE